MDPFSARGRVTKVIHLGAGGVVADLDTEVGAFRVALQGSITAYIGTKDINGEVWTTKLPGFNVGLNRDQLNGGAVFDLADQGSWGILLGCHIKFCANQG